MVQRIKNLRETSLYTSNLVLHSVPDVQEQTTGQHVDLLEFDLGKYKTESATKDTSQDAQLIQLRNDLYDQSQEFQSFSEQMLLSQAQLMAKLETLEDKVNEQSEQLEEKTKQLESTEGLLHDILETLADGGDQSLIAEGKLV